MTNGNCLGIFVANEFIYFPPVKCSVSYCCFPPSRLSHSFYLLFVLRVFHQVERHNITFYTSPWRCVETLNFIATPFLYHIRVSDNDSVLKLGPCGGGIYPPYCVMHWTNEDPKQLMMNVRTNVIRSWITGVIYSHSQRGGALYILNFIITRTLVMFKCGLEVQNRSLKISTHFNLSREYRCLREWFVCYRYWYEQMQIVLRNTFELYLLKQGHLYLLPHRELRPYV